MKKGNVNVFPSRKKMSGLKVLATSLKVVPRSRARVAADALPSKEIQVDRVDLTAADRAAVVLDKEVEQEIQDVKTNRLTKKKFNVKYRKRRRSFQVVAAKK